MRTHLHTHLHAHVHLLYSKTVPPWRGGGALTRDGVGEPRKRDARPAGSVTKGHAVWALVREKLPEQQIQLKQIGGCRGLGPEGKGEQLLTGHGVLLWGERTFRN